MIDMKVDVALLRKQRDFLLEYPWRENRIPEEVDGVIYMLDHILDVEERYVIGTA